jgi:hypothetical protein
VVPAPAREENVGETGIEDDALRILSRQSRRHRS